MRQILSSSNIAFLFTIFTLICAMNVDNALQYRQIVPRGTGSSPSITVSSTTDSSSPSRTDASSTPTPSSNGASESSSSSTLTSNDQTSDASSSPSSLSLPSSSSSSPLAESTSSTSSSSQIEDSSSSASPLPPSTSTSPTDSPSAKEASTTSSPPHFVTTTSRSVSSKIQTFQTTVVTVSGSNTMANVLTTTGLKAVSTFDITSVGPPSLGETSSPSNSSGLQHSQKMIIIGTVVGVGGALLLGGIALVAWRIWGKRKHEIDDDHDMMGLQPGASGQEKRSSISGTSPFRSTLDQYHNPAGPVNTASNF